ncbi:MAG: septum formation initiator [Rhodospirillaceae bacterium]|nr:septum formation initiator [Rhodospirillaceae bacterium]|tara:strand:- start:35 stop:349 length:315 start_codon:yes stop_codon:yes gene_type:complete
MTSAIREINLRARYIVGPLLGALAIVYFGYHVIQGDRGLITWIQKSQQIEITSNELALLEEKYAVLYHRTSMLRPESLDLDLLDERVRSVLNKVREDEIILFHK